MTLPKNVAASIAARLKNIAKDNHKNYDSVFLLYCQERLLYRLSISSYQDRFLLKGGLFLFSLTQFAARPTLDIDFLARSISNDIDFLKDVFREICANNTLNDGLVFDVDHIDTMRIKEDADYEGVRVKIPVSLGRSKKTLQLDIGFGDVVVPKAIEIKFPILLEMAHPTIFAYSIESVIAEKFEAMINLSIVNSRMKDFYDIYVLSERQEFDGRVLQEAISETFARRQTYCERNTPVFTDEFWQDNNRNQQWQAFIRRLGIEPLSFEVVMQQLATFLKPIYEANLREDEFFGSWSSEQKKWLRLS